MFFFISFTLYLAHSRVGRGNLVLRHSVPHFLPNSGGIASWVTELNSSTPERRNGKINLSKYFISSSGDPTHNKSVLQSHFVSQRHDWPHLIFSLNYTGLVTVSDCGFGTHSGQWIILFTLRYVTFLIILNENDGFDFYRSR